ncbi:hypothetical protein A5881_001573 [Enterococcus termitis]|nr:hypothetical protein A5881_002106 [Enterococcus termitis]
MTWKISETFDERAITNFGNKFLLANGYMGYRGTLEEYTKEQLVGNTILGLYDQVGSKWREPVNAPNGFSVKLFKDQNELSLLTEKPVEHTQELELYNALHHRKTTFTVDTGQLDLTIERFVSIESVHLMASKGTIVSTIPLTITLKIGIDGEVWDINGPHLVDYQLSEIGKNTFIMETKTSEAGKKLVVNQAVQVSNFTEQKETFKKEQVFREYTLTLQPNKPVEFEIFVTVYNENDCENPKEEAAEQLNHAQNAGYDRCKENHQKKWHSLWEKSDVEITGDDDAQLALRYSIYQLLAIAPRHSDKLSIPARGLSGQTYKGAVFWDTEMFMVPFFQRTDPTVARNLLMYRVHTLDGARKKAEEYGFSGAFYAWESQENGQDATSDYNVTDVFTKRPMRTYFRDKQIHISGDIAYAMWHYYRYTNDFQFLLDGAAEVVFESAKFYFSYSYFKENKNRFELIDVIGPDEYHERVYNNAYTNKIAYETVRIALDIWNLLSKKEPAFLEKLLMKTNLLNQKTVLQSFLENLYVPQPDEKTGMIEQFDGYYRLEDVSVEAVQSRLLDPQEYWGGAYGVAADTQIIKQADVICMLHLFSDSYKEEILKKNWEYYEPRTEHGSSLSACIYAIVACKFNNQDWAYPYFMKTATVDLTGESKQYAGTIYIGGTHPAANGGAWMAAILGFAGLTIKNDQLEVAPKLPRHWEKLKFKTVYQEESYTIEITQGGKKIWKN